MDLTFRPEETKAMRRVWVRWIDAVVEHNQHWIDRSTYTPRKRGGLECESMGFVVHEDKRCVVLAQSFNADSIDNLITIPRGMVLKMRDVA